MMDKKLSDLIRQLSTDDSKSLGQKALKACEEVGELAKVVLPFENAFACKHRFVDRRAILEEVADVILTVTSIANNLGFDDAELEEMIKEKALYWAELQARDRGAKFPVPYEIHITVKTDQLDHFKESCSMIGVKPLLLDLQNSMGSTVMQEVMTSSIHVGDNASVYTEMFRIANALRERGLRVIREKIETVPWHPAAPSFSDRDPKMPPNCYFECHLAIVTTEDQLAKLRECAANNGCHMSKNIFKKVDENHVKIMVTFRRYEGPAEEFQSMVHQIKGQLESNEFVVDKVITEFSIYDSKVSHDAAWLTR